MSLGLLCNNNGQRQGEQFMKEKNRIFNFFLPAVLLWGSIGLVKNVYPYETVDHSIYAELLKEYVRNGVVDYKGFKNDEADLNSYLLVLEKTDTKALPRYEQFAFYINAYNACTIKLILSGYPDVKSIKDLGSAFKSPWKKKICRIDGDVLTLDDIEHHILRPRYKDPRVHFAVNCASKGCPPLRSEPYMGISLDRQLNESAEGFINNSTYNHIKGNTLYVSKIFEWFSGDFNNDIVGYFLKYARGNLKSILEANRDRIKVKYLDYDWSLNGR